MFVIQRTVSSSILGSRLLQLKYITKGPTGWWSGENRRSYWIWIWVGGWTSTSSKKWSLWELRSCSDCGVSDVLKPLGSLTSTWGSGGLVGMKQGCNFQEVCIFTASHCDYRLVRSVLSPCSTNHHWIWVESGESLLVLHLTLRLESTSQNLWITLFTVPFTVPTVQLLTVPQILHAPSTFALLLSAVLLLAALLL